MTAQWSSAEQLLFGDNQPVVHPADAEFVARGGSSIPLDFPSRRRTSEFRENGGVGYRPGAAAFYRCQAPGPECDCNDCSRERWLMRRKQGTTRREERSRMLVRALVKRAPAFPGEP